MASPAVSLLIEGVLAAVGRAIPRERRHRFRPTQPASIGALSGLSLVLALALVVPLLYALSGRTSWFFLLSTVPAFAGWVASVVLVLRAIPNGDAGPAWTFYRFGNWWFGLSLVGWLFIGIIAVLEIALKFMTWNFD